MNQWFPWVKWSAGSGLSARRWGQAASPRRWASSSSPLTFRTALLSQSKSHKSRVKYHYPLTHLIVIRKSLLNLRPFRVFHKGAGNQFPYFFHTVFGEGKRESYVPTAACVRASSEMTYTWFCVGTSEKGSPGAWMQTIYCSTSSLLLQECVMLSYNP